MGRPSFTWLEEWLSSRSLRTLDIWGIHRLVIKGITTQKKKVILWRTASLRSAPQATHAKTSPRCCRQTRTLRPQYASTTVYRNIPQSIASSCLTYLLVCLGYFHTFLYTIMDTYQGHSARAHPQQHKPAPTCVAWGADRKDAAPHNMKIIHCVTEPASVFSHILWEEWREGSLLSGRVVSCTASLSQRPTFHLFFWQVYRWAQYIKKGY
jgi:hypothetical protein